MADKQFPPPRRPALSYREPADPPREPPAPAPARAAVVVHRPASDAFAAEQDPVAALARITPKRRPPRVGWAVAFAGVGVACMVAAFTMGTAAWRLGVGGCLFFAFAYRTWKDPDF